MATMKFIRLVALLCLDFFILQTGRSQSYLLSSLPVEKDLSSRQITCIFQDSEGFIWIGTEDGLNLYDANKVTILKHDVKNHNSILDNNIQNICEDRLGNIWIANASGVDCYDRSSDTFRHYTADVEKNKFGFKPKVYVDRKGTVWVGRDGLFRFDTVTQQFRRIINPYSSAALGSKYANLVNGFFQDSQGRYWIGTYDGLFLFDGSNSFTRVDKPPADENYKQFGILYGTVSEDKWGELRVGTWGYGLFNIIAIPDRLNGTKVQLVPVGEKGVILSYACQQLDNKEMFWYASGGLQGIDRQNNLQPHLTHRNDDPFSLRNDAIRVLFTDRQNQLWVGYEKEGIQILSPGNQLIKTHPVSSPGNKIGSLGVIAEKDGNFYIGGWYEHALVKLDHDYKIVRWWHKFPSGSTGTSTNVSDIYFDKKSNLWLATANGLILLNEKTGLTRTYKFDSSTSKRSFFLKILPEGDSALWLAGYDNGLARFSMKTQRLVLYGGQPLPFYWKILFDKHGDIWCANNSGFIDKFNPATKLFSSYHFDSLTERSIYFDITYDSAANTLWAATSNGLLKINLLNLHADLFTEKQGLPTSKINLLTWDSHHRLWIGTDHGLSVLDIRHNLFRNFYLNNGLSTEKLDHTLSIGSNGQLYIGCDNSFMTMDIAALDENKEMSPVYITAVSENGNTLHPKSKGGLPVIHLPYYENNLSFRFAITDFINSEDNQLLYQLEGWDRDMIATKQGGVTYNKLPPAKYLFRVQGINHNGVKNDRGDMIEVIIDPPFWNTWWFITIVSIVLISGFAVAVRYVSQRNLKEKLLRLEKEQAVERERNRISRDMHDDLGSGLTKIAIMSEVVKKQIHEPGKAKEQLDNISQSSRELVDSLQDIIWVLNPKNDTLDSLSAYVREYALKFFEPFSVDVEFDYPEKFPEVRLSEETRRNIFLVVKESFNNIGKHAWCNHVVIRLHYCKGDVRLVIEDDGRGFDIDHTRPFGNGLVNMKTRMEQVGGRYEISSAKGKGTRTEILVPV